MRSCRAIFSWACTARSLAYECVCRESILPAGPEPPARTRRDRALEFPSAWRLWFGHRCCTPTRRFSRRIRLVGSRASYTTGETRPGTVPLGWAKTWPTRGPGASEVPNWRSCSAPNEDVGHRREALDWPPKRPNCDAGATILRAMGHDPTGRGKRARDVPTDRSAALLALRWPNQGTAPSPKGAPLGGSSAPGLPRCRWRRQPLCP